MPESSPGQEPWLEGNRLFSAERYPDAIWAYSEAIRRDPLQPHFYHNRAVARALLADSAGALEDVWRAIELDPTSEETRRLASLIGPAGGEPISATRTRLLRRTAGEEFPDRFELLRTAVRLD